MYTVIYNSRDTYIVAKKVGDVSNIRMLINIFFKHKMLWWKNKGFYEVKLTDNTEID